MDIFTPEARSALMSRIRSKNSRAELVVRRLLHAHGFRFRLHRKDLPGTPDIVLPKHRTVVFVHGCFWHRHPGCPRATMPSSNTEFWAAKLQRNVDRFERQQADLMEAGWRVLVVWECETRSLDKLEQELLRAIAPPLMAEGVPVAHSATIAAGPPEPASTGNG